MPVWNRIGWWCQIWCSVAQVLAQIWTRWNYSIATICHDGFLWPCRWTWSAALDLPKFIQWVLIYWLFWLWWRRAMQLCRRFWMRHAMPYWQICTVSTFLRSAEEILLQVQMLNCCVEMIWNEWHTLISLVYLYFIIWLILFWGLRGCFCLHLVIKCGTAHMLNIASVECIERDDVTGPGQQRRSNLGGPVSAALSL